MRLNLGIDNFGECKSFFVNAEVQRYAFWSNLFFRPYFVVCTFEQMAEASAIFMQSLRPRRQNRCRGDRQILELVSCRNESFGRKFRHLCGSNFDRVAKRHVDSRFDMVQNFLCCLKLRDPLKLLCTFRYLGRSLSGACLLNCRIGGSLRVLSLCCRRLRRAASDPCLPSRDSHRNQTDDGSARRRCPAPPLHRRPPAQRQVMRPRHEQQRTAVRT